MKLYSQKLLFVILIIISIIYGLINHFIILPIFNNQLIHCLILSIAFGVLYYLVVVYFFKKNLTLMRYNKKLELELHIDELTQLYNRKALEDKIVALEFAESYSIIFIDIDNFKTYNDIYGHEVGDEVLKIISKDIKNSIRSLDEVYRIGGDEILIILDRCDYLSARGIAEKIKKNISKLIIKHVGSANEIIKYADLAMLTAKKKGKIK